MERRQFLGSMAALVVAGNAGHSLASEPGDAADLKWQCEIIATEPHNQALRRPVVTGVSLQPKGDLLAIVGDDHIVCMYDRGRRRFIEHLENHSDWIRATRFSPDGSKLVTAGNDRTLQVWNVGSWQGPIFARRHPGAIIEVAFSGNGQQLATVGFENKLRVYSTIDMTVVRELECSCADNHAVAYSSNGQYLAAAGRCGNVRVWSTLSWKQVSQFKAHRKRIRSLNFLNDGRIVTASDDQKIRITDPMTPKAAVELPRLAAKLFSSTMMDDGMLATGGSDNQIHVWQTGELQETGKLVGHTGTVSSLDYQDGMLVSGSYDTHVRLWSTEKNTSVPGTRHTQLRQGWGRKLK